MSQNCVCSCNYGPHHNEYSQGRWIQLACVTSPLASSSLWVLGPAKLLVTFIMMCCTVSQKTCIVLVLLLARLRKGIPATLKEMQTLLGRMQDCSCWWHWWSDWAGFPRGAYFHHCWLVYFTVFDSKTRIVVTRREVAMGSLLVQQLGWKVSF